MTHCARIWFAFVVAFSLPAWAQPQGGTKNSADQSPPSENREVKLTASEILPKVRQAADQAVSATWEGAVQQGSLYVLKGKSIAIKQAPVSATVTADGKVQNVSITLVENSFLSEHRNLVPGAVFNALRQNEIYRFTAQPERITNIVATGQSEKNINEYELAGSYGGDIDELTGERTPKRNFAIHSAPNGKILYATGVPFFYEEGRFEVDLPDDATVTFKQVEDRHSMFGSLAKSATYQITWYSIDEKMIKEKGAPGALKSIFGKDTKEITGSSDKMPGVEFSYVGGRKDRPLHFRTKAYMAGNRVYGVTIVAKNRDDTESDITKSFYQSFKIIPAERKGS